MRRKITIILTLSLITIILMGAGLAIALNNDFSLGRWTFSGGGGRSTGSGYTLDASIGQSAVGDMANESYTLTGGYWTPLEYSVHLPIVLH